MPLSLTDWTFCSSGFLSQCVFFFSVNVTFLNATRIWTCPSFFFRPHHSNSEAGGAVQSELTVLLTRCRDDFHTPSSPTRCLGKNCWALRARHTSACHHLYFAFYVTEANIVWCSLCPGRCWQRQSTKCWCRSPPCSPAASGEAAACWPSGVGPRVGQPPNSWCHPDQPTGNKRQILSLRWKQKRDCPNLELASKMHLDFF